MKVGTGSTRCAPFTKWMIIRQVEQLELSRPVEKSLAGGLRIARLLVVQNALHARDSNPAQELKPGKAAAEYSPAQCGSLRSYGCESHMAEGSPRSVAKHEMDGAVRRSGRRLVGRQCG